MVCKLVKGPECFNGLVTGTVIIHPWSVESNENLSCVRGAHRCFPSHWSYPLAVFSPLQSATKDKWFCAPFGLDCSCIGPQFVLKETQFLASLVMQALFSRVTFCLLSPFFFFFMMPLHFQSYLHSELEGKSRICQNIHHVFSFQNNIRIQACFRACASKIMQPRAGKLKSPVNIGLNF